MKVQKYMGKTENGVVTERTWTMMLSHAEVIVNEEVKKQYKVENKITQ